MTSLMCSFQHWITGVLVFVATSLIILFKFYQSAFRFWEQTKVPYLNPQIPFGNCYRSLTGKENLADTAKRLYNQFKKNGWKHGGIYVLSSPNYIPVHLDYIKNIMSNDFQHFTDRGSYYNQNDPIDSNVLLAGGSVWRNLRSKLTPAFTSTKIKRIFANLDHYQNNLLKKVREEQLSNNAIDIQELFVALTIDVIGFCTFGLHLNSLEENTEFKYFSNKVAHKTAVERFILTCAANFPSLAFKLNVKSISKHAKNFFLETVRTILSSRDDNNKVYNDFLQLLLDMNKNDQATYLTVEEIAAQCLVFIVAGYETSSTLMTFALYELAKNSDVQDKTRSEINRVLANHDGKIGYDSLQDMKYLGQVLDESLRKYPPLPLLNRKCVKDYKIPGEEIVIKKGTIALIPIMGVHYDEEYYPDPEKFDPERFSDENKSSRHKCAHIPFGAGPRACIGKQFGIMHAKMAVCCLIRNYKFTVNSKTSDKIEMEPNHFVLSPVGGIWLNAVGLE